MLASARHRPQARWAYDDPPPDLAALTAAYAFGIARNHPFVDGNERTALVVARLFLLINGFEVAASGAEKYAVFMAPAAGRMDEDELGAWLHERLLPAR